MASSSKTVDVRNVLASEKDPDLEEAVQLALAADEFRAEMLAGLVFRDDVYRHNCFKVLLTCSSPKTRQAARRFLERYSGGER